MPGEAYYSGSRHRAWRAAVLRRAKYLCQDCARYGRRTPATHAHHIMPRELYPEKQYEISNGMALCHACHNTAHPEKGGGRR